MNSILARLMAATALLAVPAAVIKASPPDESIVISAKAMPYVRTMDERFQSYQIGFSHLTGGETWKSFDALGGQPGKSIADVREARAPTDESP